MAAWARPRALLFVHVFSHSRFAYPLEVRGPADWMAQHFFTGGVMPSQYFGANAAWLRLAVIAYNVLTALKRLALPAELLRARPKRLRFLIFNTAGRMVQHARKTMLRLAALGVRILTWREAMRLLPVGT